jgi:hypothetical protein
VWWEAVIRSRPLVGRVPKSPIPLYRSEDHLVPTCSSCWVRRQLAHVSCSEIDSGAKSRRRPAPDRSPASSSGSGAAAPTSRRRRLLSRRKSFR